MTTENVLGWLLVCIGAVLLVATAWLLALARRSSAWPSTPGRIVSSRCESCEGPRFGRSTYRLVVTYAFEVAGHHVEGHRVAFGDNLWGSRSKEEVEEQVKFFHPGRNVKVAYDPQRPDRCTLNPGTGNLPFNATFAIAAALIIVGISVMSGWIKVK